MTNVLVIEGNRAGTPHFVSALRKKGYQVDLAQTGKEALQRAQNIRPDIVVINLASMRTSGKRICSLVRKTLNGKPIIVIQPDENGPKEELDADSVLVLPFTARKLLNRIKALLPQPSDKVLQAGPITLDLESNQVFINDRQVQLTPKLADLLKIMMRRHGEVLERKELFATVWQTEYTGDTRTLDVHVSWLRKALEENPRKPRFIKTVRGIGYRLDLH
jgi:DNA-binding response OmpR family regulator